MTAGVVFRLSSTSAVCWPSVGAGRRISIGVLRGRNWKPGVVTEPATGCSIGWKNARAARWSLSTMSRALRIGPLGTRWSMNTWSRSCLVCCDSHASTSASVSAWYSFAMARRLRKRGSFDHSGWPMASTKRIHCWICGA